MENSMNCREYEHIIDDYLAGRLGKPDLQRFEEHLAECESCRIRAEQDRRLSVLLKKEVVTDPGEGYWNYLEKSILARTFERRPDTIESDYREKPALTHRLAAYLVPLAASLALMFLSFSNLAIGPAPSMMAEISMDQDFSEDETLLFMEEYLQSDRLGSIVLSPPGSPLRTITIGEIEMP